MSQVCHIVQNLVLFCQTWTESVPVLPQLGRTTRPGLPKLDRHSNTFVNAGHNLGRHWPSGAKTGPTLVQCFQNWTEVSPVLSNLDPNWPSVVKTGSDVQACQTCTEARPILPHLGRRRSSVAESGPTAWPSDAKFGPRLVQCCPTWVDIGPILPTLDRTWFMSLPNLGLIGPAVRTLDRQWACFSSTGPKLVQRCQSCTEAGPELPVHARETCTETVAPPPHHRDATGTPSWRHLHTSGTQLGRRRGTTGRPHEHKSGLVETGSNLGQRFPRIGLKRFRLCQIWTEIGPVLPAMG